MLLVEPPVPPPSPKCYNPSRNSNATTNHGHPRLPPMQGPTQPHRRRRNATPASSPAPSNAPSAPKPTPSATPSPTSSHPTSAPSNPLPSLSPTNGDLCITVISTPQLRHSCESRNPRRRGRLGVSLSPPPGSEPPFMTALNLRRGNLLCGCPLIPSPLPLVIPVQAGIQSSQLQRTRKPPHPFPPLNPLQTSSPPSSPTKDAQTPPQSPPAAQAQTPLMHPSMRHRQIRQIHNPSPIKKQIRVKQPAAPNQTSPAAPPFSPPPSKSSKPPQAKPTSPPPQRNQKRWLLLEPPRLRLIHRRRPNQPNPLPQQPQTPLQVRHPVPPDSTPIPEKPLPPPTVRDSNPAQSRRSSAPPASSP